MSNKTALVIIAFFVAALVMSIVTSQRIIVRVAGKYRDERHGFTIRYPKSWEKKYDWEGNVVAFVSPKEHFDDQFQEFVTVRVGEVEPGTTLDDVVREKIYHVPDEKADPTEMFEKVAEKYGIPVEMVNPTSVVDQPGYDDAGSQAFMKRWMSVDVLKDEPVELGTLRGRRVVTKARSEGNLFQYLHYVTIKDDRYFIVSGVTRTLSYEKYEGIFTKIGESLRID